jgi:hypothetical protein
MTQSECFKFQKGIKYLLNLMKYLDFFLKFETFWDWRYYGIYCAIFRFA